MKVLLGLGLITFGVLQFFWGVGLLRLIERVEPDSLPVIARVPGDATDEWKAYIPPERDE